MSITSGKLDLVQRNANGEFQTDGLIRKGDLSHLEGRNLEGAGNAWLDPATDATMKMSAATGNWDQFAENKRLFNVTSTFDENMYTKKIDYTTVTQGKPTSGLSY